MTEWPKKRWELQGGNPYDEFLPADLCVEVYEALLDLRQDYNPSTAKYADKVIAHYEDVINQPQDDRR